MVFSSLVFIFIFLPVTLALYYVIPKKFVNVRNFVLLLMSFVFYSWGEPKYVLLMLISIVMNYIFGIAIDKFKKKKFIFWFSIFVNIGLLVYFKYTGLILSTVNDLFKCSVTIPSIILPIGISFYTFQIMSYVIDVYLGKIKVQKNILSLGTYITLFPQLVAGPIVRYEQIEDQLENRMESLALFSEGLRRFIIGLSKKMIIANNVAIFADTVFAKEASSFGSLAIWLAVLSYTLQIYFDFSGYSDMAIGLGKMFGFNFLENFNYPYIANSITDFWRRWHISLSTWFKEYVYIPLGGNRTSKIKWLRNIIIVWTLTGLWHGASWNFLLWGLYYGIILILEKTLLSKMIDKLPKVIQHIYAIFFIMIGWLIFRVENINEIFSYLKVMFSFKSTDFTLFLYENMDLISSVPYILLGIVFCLPIWKNIYEKISEKNSLLLEMGIDVLIFGLFVLCMIYLVSASYNPFIYFRF